MTVVVDFPGGRKARASIVTPDQAREIHQRAHDALSNEWTLLQQISMHAAEMEFAIRHVDRDPVRAAAVINDALRQVQNTAGSAVIMGKTPAPADLAAQYLQAAGALLALAQHMTDPQPGMAS